MKQPEYGSTPTHDQLVLGPPDTGYCRLCREPITTRTSHRDYHDECFPVVHENMSPQGFLAWWSDPSEWWEEDE